MIRVGLVTVSSSSPNPIATPRASTVFPAPSSPKSAMTSPGSAWAARRSPRRSVCSEEWLTRSRPALSGGRLLLESAAFKNEPNAKADDGADDRGPQAEVDLPLDAGERETDVTRGESGEQHETQEQRDAPPRLDPRDRGVVRRQSAFAFLVPAVLLRHRGAS